MQYKATSKSASSQARKRGCISCGWAPETLPNGRRSLYCQVCRVLSGDPVDVSFIDGRSGQPPRVASEAYMRTGRDRSTGRLGVYVSLRHCRHGLVHIEFDVFRLGLRLRSKVLTRVRRKWRSQVTPLPQTMKRRIWLDHGLCLFRFQTLPQHVEGWKRELEAVLSEGTSYE